MGPSALAVLAFKNHLELNRQLNRKVRRFLAVEDAVRVGGRAPAKVEVTDPVAASLAALSAHAGSIAPNVFRLEHRRRRGG
jgi:hypothetical protein